MHPSKQRVEYDKGLASSVFVILSKISTAHFLNINHQRGKFSQQLREAAARLDENYSANDPGVLIIVQQKHKTRARNNNFSGWLVPYRRAHTASIVVVVLTSYFHLCLLELTRAPMLSFTNALFPCRAARIHMRNPLASLRKMESV